MSVMDRAFFQHMVDGVASDTTALANILNADVPGHVVLFKAPFTPMPDLDPVAMLLTQADFDGYVANGISSATGTQNTALDPLTSDYLLQLKLPVGGFRWETTGTTNLPQTIYGFGVFN